jgi:hypothetical protein
MSMGAQFPCVGRVDEFDGQCYVEAFSAPNLTCPTGGAINFNVCFIRTMA